MGIPVVRGRDLTPEDREDSPGVVVVNEELARQAWPGVDPIGKRMRAGGARDEQEWLTVVGVVKDPVQYEWTGETGPEMYLPYLQGPMVGSYLTFVVRAAGSPAALVPTLRQVVAGLDPNVAVSELQTMDAVVAGATAGTRFNALLLIAFACVALVLAAIGIYSVISCGVTQRTQEIGIRLALGATAGEVTRLVVRQGLGPAILGTAVGLAGALALTRTASSLLYGVSPTDPLTFAAVTAALLLVALGASVSPARRASRLDPVRAIRSE
jgi:putative ABC transport system permease protein